MHCWLRERKPLFLSEDESKVYHLIAGRMIEAFSEKCVKDVTAVTVECSGVVFSTKGHVVKQAGWRAVCEEEQEETILPDWKEGELLHLSGCSMTEGKTKPKPLHTEATLLSAMETAGREIGGRGTASGTEGLRYRNPRHPCLRH